MPDDGDRSAARKSMMEAYRPRGGGPAGGGRGRGATSPAARRTSLQARRESQGATSRRNPLLQAAAAGLELGPVGEGAALGAGAGAEAKKEAKGDAAAGAVPPLRMSRSQMNINKLKAGARQLAAVGQMKKETNALSLRECVRMLFKLRRDRFIQEFAKYITYVLLFITIIFQLNNYSWIFQQNNSIVKELMIEEWEGEGFYELRSIEEVFDYMQGRMVDGLYPTEWYNGDTFTTDELGYVRHVHRLVGGVQLRQARVKPDSCESRRHAEKLSDEVPGEGRYDTKDHTCYAEYTDSDDVRDTAPFGPNGTYTWSDGHSLLDGLYGFGTSYGHGAYVVDLGLDRADAVAKLQQLRDDLWIDRGTRVVAIDFNLYNTVTRLVTVCRLVLEFPPAGNVMIYKEFESMRLILYTANLDMTRGGLEIIWFLMVCYYIRESVRGVRDAYKLEQLRRHMTSVEVLFEMLTLCMALTACVFWSRYIFSSDRRNFDVNEEGYNDMYAMAAYYRQAMNVCSITLVTCVFKVFKFFALSSRLNLLWSTLQAASIDLLSMCFVAVFIVYGFAMMATIVFGPHVEDFHGIVSSGSTLLRYVLGDFDYLAITRANPYMAPLIFTAYTAFVLLILTNVFIAVLSRYFETVQMDQIEQAKLMDITFEYDFYSRFSRKAVLRWRDWSRRMGQTRVGRALLGLCACSAGGGGDGERSRSTSFFRKSREDVETAKEGEMEELFARLERAVRWEKRLDLYKYVTRAHFQSHGAPVYLSLQELCSLSSPPGKRCDHDDCIARQLLDTYKSFKDITYLQPTITHFNARAPENKDFVFHCVKINMFGHRQRRLMFIDVAHEALVNMDPESLNVKKTVFFRQILQIEKSLHDPTRVKLIFLEGQGTFKMRFPASERRDLFCTRLEEACRNAAEARGNAVFNPPGVVDEEAPAGPAAPKGGGDAGDHAAGAPTVVDSASTDQQDLERELRSLTAAERVSVEQVHALTAQQTQLAAAVSVVADSRVPQLEQQIAAIAQGQRRLEAMMKAMLDRPVPAAAPAPAALPPPPTVTARLSSAGRGGGRGGGGRGRASAAPPPASGPPPGASAPPPPPAGGELPPPPPPSS